MPKLIDADTIKAYLQKNSVNHTLTDIDAQPTVDAVEVVRCKDCFLCETRQTANYLPFLYCKFHDCSVLGDFYCFWGIRKEDEE